MNKYLAIIVIAFLGISSRICAQAIQLQGNVFSYNSKKMVLIKKAQKDLSFEGPLAGALVSIKGKETSSSYTTGINGFYSLNLSKPGIFLVTISKAGYSTLSFEVVYKSAGTRFIYGSIFLILKEEEKSPIDLGNIEIKDGKLGLEEGKSQSGSSQDVFNSNINLLEKAVNINNNGNGLFANGNSNDAKATTDKKDSSGKIAAPFRPESKSELARGLMSDNLDTLKANLENSKNLITQLNPESEDYRFLTQQIQQAEQKIKDKQSIIFLQESEISNSRKIILYLILFLLFLVLSLGISYYFFKEKKKYATTLSDVNDSISKINSRLLSSIRYASVIQENFLPPPGGLSRLFVESFLYSRPKDILSGDFHWYAEKNNHKIILVGDCTGHGVPGAMLTVLGNRILDETIRVKGEVLPSKILMELNASIMETFSLSNEQLDYGIDISVISLNTKTGELFFSGIGNGIYRVSEGNLKFYTATPKSLGTDLTKDDLQDQLIDYKKGDSFYLFSDGYADQFAGNDPERTKFNLKRFADLILKIEKTSTLSAAPEIFEKELKNWMGENNMQVDDICILGFKI